MLKLLKAIGKLEKANRQSKKRVYPKVSDFIPKKKGGDGVWCSPSQAEAAILRYYAEIPASNLSAEKAIGAFQDVLTKTSRELRVIRTDWEKDLQGHREHASKQLSEVEDSDNDEKSEILEDLREEERPILKVLRWVQQEEDKLKLDCRKPLRAVLASVKNSEEEGYYLCAESVETERDYQYPDVPDRYYD